VSQRFLAQFVSDTETPTLARRQLDRWLPDSLAEDDRGALRLLVSELVTNCVRHANAGEAAPVELAVRVAPDTIRVEVHDGGAGFDPARTRRPRGVGGGYGLFLVERMASRWGVDRDAGTRVWFELDLAPAA
jgi:anti-sigma regulatory factor (Ser/Thr protein kinase)